MKETRFFYCPDAAQSHCLPDEEAQHAVRVLRLKEGDEIAERLPGFELGAFSQENIQVHKWCASIVLLLEGSLDANSLVVEDVRNVLKKAKKPHILLQLSCSREH